MSGQTSGFLDRQIKNYHAQFRAFAAYGIYDFPLNGVPVDGVTGVGVMDFGSSIFNPQNGNWYFNVGTIAAPVWQVGSGPGGGLVKTMTLTSAQVKALRATPITIVPAFGVGTVLEFQEASLYLLFGSNAFTNPQNLQFRLQNGSGQQVSAAITGSGFIDQANSIGQLCVIPSAVTATKAQGDNQPIVLHNEGGSEITGNAAGDNKLIVNVTYRVSTPGW